MSKAFTREDDSDLDDDLEETSSLPVGSRNYMTPGGFARLKNELNQLVEKERPETVAIVSWAAGNGDRSENGDYIYGKKRLREIDRRIRFLIKHLDTAEIVDHLSRRDVDDSDISWVSPMAKALIKAREGDVVTLKTPGGIEDLEILEVRYQPLVID